MNKILSLLSVLLATQAFAVDFQSPAGEKPQPIALKNMNGKVMATLWIGQMKSIKDYHPQGDTMTFCSDLTQKISLDNALPENPRSDYSKPNIFRFYRMDQKTKKMSDLEGFGFYGIKYEIVPTVVMPESESMLKSVLITDEGVQDVDMITRFLLNSRYSNLKVEMAKPTQANRVTYVVNGTLCGS